MNGLSVLQSQVTGPVWTIVQSLSFPFFLQSMYSELPITHAINTYVLCRGVFIFLGLHLATRAWAFSLIATGLLLAVGYWFRAADAQLSK